MHSSDRIALRLHIEAVWYVRLPAIERDELELLSTSSLPSWRLCVADLPAGRVQIWRPDVPLYERAALRERIFKAVSAPTPPSDIHREVALRLATSPARRSMNSQAIVRSLTPDDSELVAAFDPAYVSDLLNPACHPCIGVLVDGRLLSLAHSSRRTEEACELGIETRPEARRKGYALAATTAWSAAILQEGLTPLYSAHAENAPSLRLAAAAGYRAFAHVVFLT